MRPRIKRAFKITTTEDSLKRIEVLKKEQKERIELIDRMALNVDLQK